MRMFRKDEGFTLVELMVVVLIIGILVAVAIPVFNSASASARRRACQANLRTLDGAVEQWASANPANNKADITTPAIAQSKLAVADPGDGSSGIYVKDWAKSTECPGGAGQYTITAGPKFNCPGTAANGAGFPHYY